MTGFLGLIPGDWWGYIISAASGAVLIIGAWITGKRSANAKRDAQAAKAAAKSTKDMNNVDTMRDASDDARIERMRQFERENRS